MYKSFQNGCRFCEFNVADGGKRMKFSRTQPRVCIPEYIFYLKQLKIDKITFKKVKPTIILCKS